MKHRTLAYALAGLGAVLVIAGLVVMLAVVPSMKKLPADTNEARSYDGTLATLLDPQTFTFVKDQPMTIARSFKVTATSGDLAQVQEKRVMSVGGTPIKSQTFSYVVDNKTMMSVSGDQVPSDWAKTEGYWAREGLTFSWPIDTQKQDYPGWSEDYRDTVTLKYAGEAQHAGATLLHYTSASGPQPMAAAEVEALGLPAAVPTQALQALLATADFGAMSGIVKDQLPALLKAWPQATVPLDYYYEYEGDYWIDPATGVVIDTTKHELRKAGLGADVKKGSLLAALPEAQQAMLRVAVSDYSYKQAAASVKDAMAHADELAGELTTYGTILPWTLIGIGLVLGAVGIVLLVRKRA